MIKFTPILMYPRLKLFSSMLAAKTQPKMIPLTISKVVLSSFGMYLYGAK